MLNARPITGNTLSLPLIDLGALWSFLKVNEPIRSDHAEKVAFIRDAGHQFPEAIVHRTSDGKLYHTPIEEGTGELLYKEAQLIIKPTTELTDGKDRIKSPLTVGELGAVAEANVQRALITSFYGKKAAPVLAKLAIA